jgi:hypothetical protein
LATQARTEIQHGSAGFNDQQHQMAVQKAAQTAEDADQRLHTATVAQAAAKLALKQYIKKTGSGKTQRE